MVRKEGGREYLLFNPITYRCYLLNEIGFKLVNLLPAISEDELARKTGLEKDTVSTFLRSLATAEVVITDGKTRKFESRQNMPSLRIELENPIRTTWLITNRCNLMCKHCYIRASPYHNEMELPFSDIRVILRKLANAEVFVLYFTGGEPFVRGDFMDIVAEASSLGLKIGVSTNAMFITERISKMLAKLGVFRVQVSLDGATKETHEFIRGPNTFDKTLSGIKNLVESGVDVGITFVCHNGNVHELERVVQLAAHLKVKGIKISPLMAWGRARNELREYIPPLEFRAQILRNVFAASENVGVNLFNELHIDVGMPEEDPYGCPLVMGITLLPDARVIPCEVFAETLNSDVVLGDLKTQTVQEVWQSRKAKQFRSAASVVEKVKCQSCPYLRSCGSYCLAEVYLKYGMFSPSNEYFKECRSLWKQVLPSITSGLALR